MSALTHSVSYGSEPYRLPAGLLAVAVHGAFFALLYFGFSWQTQPAATMSVELWDSLPSVPATPPVVEAPPVEASPVEVVEPPQPPEPVVRPKHEISLPEKKPRPPEKKVEAKPELRQPTAQELAAAREQAERAERVAAAARVVDEYTAKIKNKIMSKIVMPPDVPDGARAEFLVTVLPGGTVLNPRLSKSSGNEAYDSAVERAILKAQPLPLPPDPALFKEFRELRLSFQPKKE